MWRLHISQPKRQRRTRFWEGTGNLPIACTCWGSWAASDLLMVRWPLDSYLCVMPWVYISKSPIRPDFYFLTLLAVWLWVACSTSLSFRSQVCNCQETLRGAERTPTPGAHDVGQRRQWEDVGIGRAGSSAQRRRKGPGPTATSEPPKLQTSGLPIWGRVGMIKQQDIFPFYS